MIRTFVDDEVKTVTIEKINDKHIIHVNVYKWSKTIYKQFIEVFVDLREVLRYEGVEALYCAFAEDNKTGPRFATMFGFEMVTVIDGVVIMRSVI